MCFLSGSRRKLRTLSSLVSLWNVGRILVGICYYDNGWVSTSLREDCFIRCNRRHINLGLIRDTDVIN